MKGIFILLMLVLLFTCGCKSDNFWESDKLKDYHVNVDTPMQKPNAVDFINQLNKSLGIYSLHSGFDSAQIRIWFFTGGLPSQCNLIVLKNNGEWKANYFHFILKDYIVNDTAVLRDLSIRRLYPRDWSMLMGALFENNIKNLPDCYNLKGYNMNVPNPDGCQIEYSDKKIYRHYTYLAPNYFDSHMLEQRQIQNIILIISNELSLPQIKKRMLDQ